MPILRGPPSNLQLRHGREGGGPEEDSLAVSTQTESEEDSVDCVDSAIVVSHQNRATSPIQNIVLLSGQSPPPDHLDENRILEGGNERSGFREDRRNQREEGFLRSIFTRVLPTLRKQTSTVENPIYFDRRTISTQTEEQDPATAKGQQLSYLVIQELALRRRTPSALRDDVFESLCNCVTEILKKHSILFNGMVRRIEVTHYHMFASVANELFEANSDNEFGQLRITWGRICSLFAFTVRLVQEYREDQARVDSVTRFLASYMTKHVIPFVSSNGGWSALVEQFPLPEDTDGQFKRAMIWSGLCVGLLATMYVSSLMR